MPPILLSPAFWAGSGAFLAGTGFFFSESADATETAADAAIKLAVAGGIVFFVGRKAELF